MANEKIKQNYKDIANAIRAKTGENGLMTAEEMPTKIGSIETGITPSGTKNITSNGNDIDVTEFAAVNVNVPNPSTGTLNIWENGDYNVTNYAYAHVSTPSTSINMTEGIEYYLVLDSTTRSVAFNYAMIWVAQYNNISGNSSAPYQLEELYFDEEEESYIVYLPVVSGGSFDWGWIDNYDRIFIKDGGDNDDIKDLPLKVVTADGYTVLSGTVSDFMKADC